MKYRRTIMAKRCSSEELLPTIEKTILKHIMNNPADRIRITIALGDNRFLSLVCEPRLNPIYTA